MTLSLATFIGETVRRLFDSCNSWHRTGDLYAYEYLTQNFNSCNFSQFFSCGGVYASGYTSLFGIPFYATGLVWFPLVFALGLMTSKLGMRRVNSELLLPLLMLGNVFTIYGISNSPSSTLYARCA